MQHLRTARQGRWLWLPGSLGCAYGHYLQGQQSIRRLRRTTYYECTTTRTVVFRIPENCSKNPENSLPGLGWAAKSNLDT
eukprot:2286211-Rhodomonas_salina.3